MRTVAQEIGALLQETREAAGLTIEHVSRAIKIRPKYLRALEEGNIAELPGNAYLLGYLRDYANHLSLNSEDLITRYKMGDERLEVSPGIHLPEPYREDFHPNKLTLLISILLAILVYAAWYKINQETVHSTMTDSILYGLNMSAKEAPTHALSPVASGSGNSANHHSAKPQLTAGQLRESFAQKEAKLILLAKESTWVKIYDASSQLLSEAALKSGDTFFVPDEKGLVITAGKPDAVEILVNGELKYLQDMSIQNAGQGGKLSASRFMPEQGQ